MSSTPPTRVRMKDVARAASVSAATVSFVLNETPGQTIRPETRSRVLRAAAALGYRPNTLARALREGTSRVVLLELGSLGRSGAGDSLVDGMQEELARHGFGLVVHYDRSVPARTMDLASELTPRATIDLAALYSDPDRPDEDGGWRDGLAAHAWTQLAHLAERGHRRIAFAEATGQTTGAIASRRRSHTEEAARRLGMATPEHLVLPDDPDGAIDRVASLRERRPDVSAIACLDDDTALRVLAAMSRSGLMAPDDLAVIGFDETPHGALWMPALTTVRIDAAEAGRRAARLAIGLDPGRRRASPSTVVVRATT